MDPKNGWTHVISSKHNWWSLNLKEVWRYRDLVLILVHRDFVTSFKQTILGPLWFFITPLFTTVVFVIVFGNIAKLPTNNIPHWPFYLSGIILWNYFSNCLNGASNVFRNNAGIFGKVYFPRLVMPITIVLSNLMQFGVQYLLFLGFVVYYAFLGTINPNAWVLVTPFLIALMGLFALGMGMIFSSLTTKYTDLSRLLSFGVSLYMYATPVIWPLSMIEPGYKRQIMELNPLTGIFECFKYAYLGRGDFRIEQLMISTVFILGLLLLGTLVFNKVEKSFMDTV